jgi:hypothetical protein
MTDSIGLNLKDQDVIKLSSDNLELNGYFLIDKITDYDVHLTQPNKKFVLEIEDQRIKEVNTVTLVYSSTPIGYAQTRDFLPNKRINIRFKEHDESFNGLIVALEKDRIEVLIDNGKTIFIDFGYHTIPSFIEYIDLEDDYVFEPGQYYFIPDSQHRFTLESQLVDLMDALLSTKQTPKVIQTAIRIVKRYRELLLLFSNTEHEQLDTKLTIHPHDVKWIVPITETLNRTIFIENEDLDRNDSRDYVDELVHLQKQQSFQTNYKKILETMNPFTIEAGATTVIQNTLPVLLKKGKYYKEPLKKGKNKLSTKTQKTVLTKEWIVQVMTKPYDCGFSTMPERITLDSYMKQPDYMIQYTKGYVPGTSLTEKVMSNFIAPFSKIANGDIHENVEECIPSMENILHTPNLFYSVQPYVKQAMPFLVYKNNINIDETKTAFKIIQSNIASYTKLYTQPAYVQNALHEIDEMSASEWQVRILSEDNGSGYALQSSKHAKMIIPKEPGLFKLKAAVSKLGGYKSQEEYEKIMDTLEHKNHRKLQSLLRIKHKRETKYNDAFASLRIEPSILKTSPKAPLLMYILQKPYEERYVELKQFIRRNTRPAFKLDDQEWFYCKVTNIKLLPKLFDVLIDAFENDTYADTLKTLSANKRIQADGANLYIYGFPVSELNTEDRFEDVVRSSELVEDELYEYREDDPMAGSVAMLLTYIGQIIEVDLFKYMNMMIYEIVQEKDKETMVVYCIAIVLKVSNIIYQIDIVDALKLIMSRGARISAAVRRIRGFIDMEINDAPIRKAIGILSKKPSIQRLEIKKGKQLKVDKTDSTVWPTFLPPLLQISKKPLDVPMQIIYDIQEVVKDAPTLDNFPRVNTLPILFLPDRSVLSRIPPKVHPFYDVNVKINPYFATLHHPEKDNVTFLNITSQDRIPPHFIDYAVKLGELKETLRNEKVPVIFNGKYTVPLHYLRTFIQNIARTFPNIIINNVHQDTIIPLSIHDLLSRSHHETLFRKLESQYQSVDKLKGYGKEVLKKIIEDEEIAIILQKIKMETNEDSYIEYEYYMLLIYDKYKRFDEINPQYAQTTELLNAFTTTFNSNAVLLTYEEIQKYVLKTKAIESNGIVEMRNTMTSSDRHIFDFRQAQNISLDAQIGRTREYDARRYDAESTWAEEHPDEAELGEDGNNEAENNDEGE